MEQPIPKSIQKDFKEEGERAKETINLTDSIHGSPGRGSGVQTGSGD